MRASAVSALGFALGLSLIGSVVHGVVAPLTGMTFSTLSCLLAGLYVGYLLSCRVRVSIIRINA